MEIKTKYNTGQEVWFLSDNGIVKGNILNINTLSNSKDTFIQYGVSHEKTEGNFVVKTINEKNLFTSRKELIEKLCG